MNKNRQKQEAATPKSIRSVSTSNFAQILSQLGISVVISTYQAGKLIIIRPDGENLNTHFKAFDEPTGLAVNGPRMAVATDYQVWEYVNMPALARILEPKEKHDGCFLPRHMWVTGNIDMHEIAYGKDGIWCVNTRLSCLCTLDHTYNFVPRWRPHFITHLAFEDRCHMNGLGMVNGVPKYVTALGEANHKEGWRDNKANGGILMDVETNQVLRRGLSMPHSPRWYRDKLWLLESGVGTVATVDPISGEMQTVAKLPGFTRGLDFHGKLAFVGLSQVRETAVFSGIPIVEQKPERNCGVWVVNIETGNIVAFLKFEEGVEEIFSVQVLPGMKFPEILDEGDKELIASSLTIPPEAMKDLLQ